MSKSKTNAKTEPKARETAKAPKVAKADAPAKRKPAGDAKPKRVSALDAAREVLKTAGAALGAKDLIAAMAEQKLWSSPNGKTPDATLYAAILREINVKGTDARFRKIERGKFEFVG